MTKLSSAAWAVHDLGLAACFGGQLFGKVAMNPKLGVLNSEEDRGRLLNAAWNRYNILNSISFASAAVSWFPGRLSLSGREIDEQTRSLVLAKDVLFGAGALTGFASVVQGLALTNQASQGAVPIKTGTMPAAKTPDRAATLLRSVNLLSNANIAIVGGIIGVTSILSIKSSGSIRFTGVSRRLP